MRLWLLLVGAIALAIGVEAANRSQRLRQECRAECGPRIETDCGALPTRKAKRCRKQVLRECRKTSIDACAVTTSSTTSVTTTNAPTTTGAPTSSTTLFTFPPLCGNGVIDPGEKCDGANIGEGYCIRGGPVTCLSSCGGWNYNGCFSCGNGIREGLEDCDGDDIGDATCPAEATGGSPICESGCRLDYEPCVQCGDGDTDPGEWCDDGNHDAEDGCSPTCQSECGDGIVENPIEMCDDGGRVNGDGCGSLCELDYQYKGGGNDASDCAVEWGAASPAGLSPTLTCTDGQTPCDRLPEESGTCRFLVYYCMNMPSSAPCAWRRVRRVELVGVSVTPPTALSDADQTTVLGAFAATLEKWGGATVTGENPVREATSVPHMLCGQFELDVAAGTSKTIALRLEDHSEPPNVDQDAFALACTPAVNP